MNIAHRYERGGLIITSNHPFGTWGRIFVDETMAVAAADSQLHHVFCSKYKEKATEKRPQKQWQKSHLNDGVGATIVVFAG
ncbi:ATP-binding protein (plasmid) [Serratia nevei]